MGFNSVYCALREVFPKVDTRILRAVAIEHSKDADVAVEAVLMEVIPFLSKDKETAASGSSSSVLVKEEYHPGLMVDTFLVDATSSDGSVGNLNGSSYYDTNSGRDQGCGYNGNKELVSLGKCEERDVKVGPYMTSKITSITVAHENRADDDLNPVNLNTESEEISSLRDLSSVKVDQGSHLTKNGDACTNGIITDNLLTNWEDSDGPAACDCNMVIHGESSQEQLYLDENRRELGNSLVQWPASLVQECTPDAPEGSLQLAVVVPSTLNLDYEKLEPSGTSSSASKKDASTGVDFEDEPRGTSSSASKKDASTVVDFEDDSALNTVVTRSGQFCRIDLLEDIINDARNNKKTLFSAMESVISLMKEVELQEKAAELAKEEAVKGGLDILTRVEDLKEMLQHAKEANDMHAGEVYGEKAILATEVKELQFRLLSLSDEKDKSLVILDEMHQTLEERLDAAEKERRAAEQEKMEKEESARNLLGEQELIMEKVVQESKILKQEAEQNSKLQEFLIDRGRVVDMLQGEIFVICQDVKLLKEKFDDRVPLSKSLSSSQTSRILASSSASLKSITSDQVPEQAEASETPKKISSTPTVDDQLSSGEEKAKDNQKAPSDDDGWEFFEV